MTTKKRTAADIVRDPVLAQKTYSERVNYLNMPEVQRAMAMERADRQEPITDTPRQSTTTKNLSQMIGKLGGKNKK